METEQTHTAEFRKLLPSVNGQRAGREACTNYILGHPEMVPFCLELAEKSGHSISVYALWALEMAC